MSSEQIHLFDTTLLLFRNRRLSHRAEVCQESYGYCVSLLMAIVFSPFMLVIALLIKLYDGGPVFYKQERLTLDKRFSMF